MSKAMAANSVLICKLVSVDTKIQNVVYNLSISVNCSDLRVSFDRTRYY